MRARIIEGASALFMKKNKMIGRLNLKSYLAYADTLKRFEGVVMTVSKEYGNRIVLKYPEEIIKDGKQIVGIDIETDLVEWCNG